MIILLCLASSQMKSYSIQFIAKPQKGKKRTWSLMNCSDMDKVKERLVRVGQLTTLIAGPSSEILVELIDWVNILQSCDPTWRRVISIADLRAYTFFISLRNKQAIITAKIQGRLLHKIGLPKAPDMDSYQKVINFMYIFIRLLEGMNSPNEAWVKDMSTGKVDPYQDMGDVTELQQALSLLAILQKPQAQSKFTSHPPEITIAVPPSSYEIIITRH